MNRRVIGGESDFSVKSFNILANSLSDAFPKVNPEYLTWRYRKQMIIDEILSHTPDIIGLQEVDEDIYNDFSFEGYKKCFIKKPGNSDGCAVFVSSAFEIIKKDFILYSTLLNKPSNQVAIVLLLKHVASSQEIIFVNTHLKAKTHEEDARVEQATAILNYIGDKRPAIIVGDMNTFPDGRVYPLFSDYHDVYKGAEYTTYKVRSSSYAKVSDYIFYSGFSLVNKLEIPPLSTFGENGLPSATYPSDHLSIMAGFNILKHF